MMNKDVLFSSKTDLWETPQDFFDMLDAEFGFTLDAAADAQNHKCPCYYTREQDGLKQPWPGRCGATHHTVGRSASGCKRPATRTP